MGSSLGIYTCDDFVVHLSYAVPVLMVRVVGGVNMPLTGQMGIFGEWAPGGSDGKKYDSKAGDAGDPGSLGWEDSLEKGMAIHSSILAWRIPWTEESGRL